MILCDLHVHTDRDHGHSSAAEMAAAASRAGLQTLGLVGHAATVFPCHYAMTEENEAAFLAETEALRRQYAGRLAIFRGIELDYFSPLTEKPYDYRIGSVHYVDCGGEILSVDSDPNDLIAGAKHHFGGDWQALCRRYYETVAGLGAKFAPHIVGHIDLVTKFNEGDCLFSTEDRRYRHAAMEAVDVLLTADPLFEINTGAISRRCRTTPYPAPFLLRHIRQRGGRILLSSDAHHHDHLCFGFDTAAQLARSCGFRTAWRLTPDGWQETAL